MTTMTKRLLAALAVVAVLLFILMEAVTTYTGIQTARKAKAEADLAEARASAATSVGYQESSGTDRRRQLLASPPTDADKAAAAKEAAIEQKMKEIRDRQRKGQP